MNSSILYEGDSRIHIMPSENHPDGSYVTAELQAWAGRIDAVWNVFHSIAEWFDRQTTNAGYRQIERHLSLTTGRADLERRLRELERGNRFPA
ncbi:MAG: hypothetical protein HY661_16060 [Betaproteobacteria bacterium]|nr:hypothetical protein [Betaproteobacteria bacterium]